MNEIDSNELFNAQAAEISILLHNMQRPQVSEEASARLKVVLADIDARTQVEQQKQFHRFEAKRAIPLIVGMAGAVVSVCLEEGARSAGDQGLIDVAETGLVSFGVLAIVGLRYLIRSSRRHQ